MKIVAIKERAKGENRVAITPDVAKLFIQKNYEVIVEKNIGISANFTDAEYIFTDDEGAENLRFSAVPVQNVIKAAKSQIKKKDTVLQISQKPEYNSPYEVDTPFLITLSSGSTGEPKPVIVTEKNKFDRAAQAVDLYEISSQDVILNASPFFQSLGQRLTFVPILTGATLGLLERFSVSRWIKSVESFGVTFTIAVSSHLHSATNAFSSCDFSFAGLNRLAATPNAS